MAGEIGLALLGTGLGLGLRHGVDWDHIAAITDVTSGHRSRLRSLAMGTLYAAGHAAVVVMLGLAAIWGGTKLPPWVDLYMESAVGVTLILLAAWIFWSMRQNGGRPVLRSRWMLVFDALRVLFRRLRRTAPAVPRVTPARSGYGPAASTGIGMIHGIGAETGTQALLLAAAAGATSASAGGFLLVAFAVGLVVSNTLIAVASIAGLVGMRASYWTQVALGAAVGGFSLVVGFIFLFHESDALPGLFA